MRVYQVDAFTTVPFRGNSAAVCLLDKLAPDGWMQNLVMEMNLSETAFAYRQDDGVYRLRWFTPVQEVNLCGHATLATAHVMREVGIAGNGETIRFATNSGELLATINGDRIQLDFPATPAEAIDTLAGLVDALGGVKPLWVGVNGFDILVALATAKEVRALRPNLELLVELPCRGVIVTAVSDDQDYDFVSRFFAPRVGIPEDPVTGSAHCTLAPLWTERLGRNPLRGYQASARGGYVDVEVRDNRVLLTGEAVTVFIADLAELATLASR